MSKSLHETWVEKVRAVTVVAVKRLRRTRWRVHVSTSRHMVTWQCSHKLRADLHGVESVDWGFLVWMSGLELEDYVMGVIKRLTDEEKRKTKAPPRTDKDFIKSSPNLWEFLTVAEFPDGGTRQLSTISTFVRDGRWTLILRDPDNQRCLWSSGETYQEAWETLEELAGDPKAQWREDRYSGPSGTAKRQKR